MIVFLTVINVILTVVIIVMVLLQQGKGSDLGSAFGGGSSNSMFGALGPSDFLGKLTYAVVAIWLILSLLLAYLLKTENTEVIFESKKSHSCNFPALIIKIKEYFAIEGRTSDSPLGSTGSTGFTPFAGTIAAAGTRPPCSDTSSPTGLT